MYEILSEKNRQRKPDETMSAILQTISVSAQ